jgi:CBS domain containing-hemolysin-like protein
MSLEEINDETDIALPEVEGVETISGFILNLLGSLPKEKEHVKFQNYQFTVEKISKNRILKVRLEILPMVKDENSKASQSE